MTTTSTAGPGGLGTAVQSRSLLQGAAAGAAVATLVNAALWAGGRAADRSSMVSGALVTQVGILSVALTTLLTFTVGTGLLALAARRSRQWVAPSSSQPPWSPSSRQALPCRPLRTPRPACCWRRCTW
jgi:Family of unknown function (DUF6069)